MHTSSKVRGELRRSFMGEEELTICLASNVEEARRLSRKEPPEALLLLLSVESLEWAAHLRQRYIAPVVFCASESGDTALYQSARRLGLSHFVELPGHDPVAWDRHAPRIAGTLRRAIAEHLARTKSFGRSTRVMQAIDVDRAMAQIEEPESRSGQQRSGQQRRQRRETVVRVVREEDLA